MHPRKYPSEKLYPFFSMGYMTTIMASIILFPLIIDIGTFHISASLLSYPLTYLFSTIVAEQYGPKNSQKLIINAIICGNLYSLAIYFFNYGHLYVTTPETESYIKILSSDLRYTIAGTIAMVCGTGITVWIIQRTKLVLYSKRLFWIRLLVAMLIGELANTTLVFLIGLYGTQSISEIIHIIYSSYAFKALYAIPISLLGGVVNFFVRGYETRLGVEHAN